MMRLESSLLRNSHVRIDPNNAMTGNFCIDQSCKRCSRNLHALRLTASGISTRKLLHMSRFRFQIFFVIAFGALVSPAFSFETFPPASGPLVSGSKATLRYGVAAAPINAPLPVKRAIWAANQLRRKPYRYGGGHRSFFDDAYDCSGTVSYVLAAAGLVRSPISSDEFRSFGSGGEGKWITARGAGAGTRPRSSSGFSRWRCSIGRWYAATTAAGGQSGLPVHAERWTRRNRQ